MRVVLIGFAVVFVLFSCGLAIRYNQNAVYAQKELNGERYKRMTLEESLQQADVHVDSLQLELKIAQDKAKTLETVLEKTKLINEDLKVRLEKAVQIKAAVN
jgi:hypothetical protein